MRRGAIKRAPTSEPAPPRGRKQQRDKESGDSDPDFVLDAEEKEKLRIPRRRPRGSRPSKTSKAPEEQQQSPEQTAEGIEMGKSRLFLHLNQFMHMYALFVYYALNVICALLIVHCYLCYVICI